MSISVSTKDSFYALYLGESTVANDRIVWQEVALISNDDTITCYGVLSADSLGLVNYKDKAWYPNGKKAVLKVNGSQEKDAWDKEESKFKKIPTPKDELLLYKLLKKAIEQHPQTCFTGHISPWLNPFYWEFLQEDANSLRAQKMQDDLVCLNPCTQTLLTQSEIDAFIASMPKAKYGGFKGETESSRIKARMDFMTLQMADVAQFRDLYDLASQIVMATEGSEHFTATKILELSIAKTLELTAIILGA
jgi:hypothetical protein